MASSILSQPGSEYGPCKGECQHIDCLETRAMATSICPICLKAIGYNKRFYKSSTTSGFVHAICEEDRIEAIYAAEKATGGNHG